MDNDYSAWVARNGTKCASYDCLLFTLQLFCSLGGDVLSLCHDKQTPDVHQPRPFNSQNGQGPTYYVSMLWKEQGRF